MDSVGIRHTAHLALIASLVLGITLIHFLTRHGQIYYHLFYVDLYFLPIIMAGLWYGLRGAVITSAAITILYFPFILWRWQGFSSGDFDRIIQVLLLNTIAVVLGMVSDRQKREQKALREAESMAAMGRAVSFLAHDMKAPLMVIGGMATQLHRGKPPDDGEAQKLSIIAVEAQRLELMVRDLLLFSRPLSLNLIQGDINGILGRCLLVASEAASERGIEVVQALGKDLPPALVDPPRLEQALTNLLLNAIQATPKRGIVRVGTAKLDGAISVVIEDQGPGIPPEIRARIFEPFFTTKEEGTGLGLPIVKRIIEAHNARIELRDAPHGGTLTVIEIPRA
jgi:two-component system, NtrC family, sensor histidine kinase HydH